MSPESNETLERRHLKSILKKLSHEGTSSDEDKERTDFKKRENFDFRKLLRDPTIEGYAARHKKLTKSVTFDNDTLLTSTESLAQENTEKESKSIKKFSYSDSIFPLIIIIIMIFSPPGFSQLSPTGILTLQLSNLSMIPIVGSNVKKNLIPDNLEEKNILTDEEVEMETIISNILDKLQEKLLEKIKILEMGKDGGMNLYPIEENEGKASNFLSCKNNQGGDGELLPDIISGVQQIMRNVLVSKKIFLTIKLKI